MEVHTNSYEPAARRNTASAGGDALLRNAGAQRQAPPRQRAACGSQHVTRALSRQRDGEGDAAGGDPRSPADEDDAWGRRAWDVGNICNETEKDLWDGTRRWRASAGVLPRGLDAV